VIAAAAQAKTVADAATTVEAEARATDRRTIAGIGTNEGKNCFAAQRYIHTSNIGSHYEWYSPCNHQHGDCAYCGTLGKCCAFGVVAGSCTGGPGGFDWGESVCVAGESDAVVKAAAAATGKCLGLALFLGFGRRCDCFLLLLE
jgi:hypothetical protein